MREVFKTAAPVLAFFAGLAVIFLTVPWIMKFFVWYVRWVG